MRFQQLTGPLLLAACAALAAGGCGESRRGAVQGKVTVNGVPLEEGTIAFVGLGGSAGPSAGAKVVKGAYTIPAEKGPFAGEYQVQIRAYRATGQKVWDGMGDDRDPAGKRQMVGKMESYVPARYNDASELRATIKAGAVNVHDFALEVGR
jgi:hypothetical protein